MIKVITYGTYDLLHYGHIRLLKRAKALGDHLIVGVTADTFDRERGKINVQQTLMERVEAVRATGLADEIIIEEYEGQKIDDIRRYNVDIFTVGSDWKGKFDYLREYCQVVYLERTEGVSSTEIRAEKRSLRLGLVGESPILGKIAHESGFVNGMEIGGVYTINDSCLPDKLRLLSKATLSFDALMEKSDALYIISEPRLHYDQIKQALLRGKHILCESPIAMRVEQWRELTDIARRQGLVLMDSIKTAYSLAYHRLRLLAKSGIIGDIYSVDATCTSLFNFDAYRLGDKLLPEWNSICAWGPTALLPIYQLLGTDYSAKTIATHLAEDNPDFDLFTKISFVYPHAVASMKVGRGVKSEGELVISGTKGYIYVPAPWWKTDYFEVRYEDPADNKRYFYQLDGEGLRYELVSFLRSIQTGRPVSYVSPAVSEAIVGTIADFEEGRDRVEI
ncbi:putative glycerol-3-phosphate cytidylyltransferase [Segatella baroniae F0067]|uniref:Putative glycerol-3-phosphate cytidylyltransferase n=1 Tax=Segatella baroniae F0067 TaxID=1115809 RepID=U2P369_9BACT|nr:adenylyltransferase/cytidyltransferase family protein [Segatella baroniae]ERK38144.1 putative glycerol-3-phosphate cytidylyltransferase [Segatella baroniae F0067]